MCIMVKNQTCFMIWFLHGDLQSCCFVSIEFPKSSYLGQTWFLHGNLQFILGRILGGSQKPMSN